MDNTVDRDWKKCDKGMSDRLRGLFAVWLRRKDCQAGESICAHPARTLVWAAVNRRRTLLVWHQQQFRVVTAIKHFRKHNALPRKQFVGIKAMIFVKIICKSCNQYDSCMRKDLPTRPVPCTLSQDLKTFALEFATIRGSKNFFILMHILGFREMCRPLCQIFIETFCRSFV